MYLIPLQDYVVAYSIEQILPFRVASYALNVMLSRLLYDWIETKLSRRDVVKKMIFKWLLKKLYPKYRVKSSSLTVIFKRLCMKLY